MAVARTKYKLYIPDSLVPAAIPASTHIVKLRKDSNDDIFGQTSRMPSEPKKKYSPKTSHTHPIEKKYSVEKSWEVNKDAYKSWTASQDEELVYLYESDNSFFSYGGAFRPDERSYYFEVKKAGVLYRADSWQIEKYHFWGVMAKAFNIFLKISVFS